MSKLSYLAVDVKAAVCLEAYPQDRLGNLVLRHRGISKLEETNVRLSVPQDVSFADQGRYVVVRFTLNRRLRCIDRKESMKCSVGAPEYLGRGGVTQCRTAGVSCLDKCAVRGCTEREIQTTLHIFDSSMDGGLPISLRGLVRLPSHSRVCILDDPILLSYCSTALSYRRHSLQPGP
jgi:hypothetical protein